jgi:hypothetical protein
MKMGSLWNKDTRRMCAKESHPGRDELGCDIQYVHGEQYLEQSKGSSLENWQSINEKVCHRDYIWSDQKHSPRTSFQYNLGRLTLLNLLVGVFTNVRINGIQFSLLIAS